jgi:hypothetical protein
MSIMTPGYTHAYTPEAVATDSHKGYIYVRGIVKDSTSDEILPYASVVVDSGERGILTNEKGIFELYVPPTAKNLNISCFGYEKQVVQLRRTSHNMYAIYLTPSKTELNEVVVKRKKYSKKNNPALDFLERIKHQSSHNDPRNHQWYSYDKYQRISLAINNFDPNNSDNVLLKKFPFLAEHVDTSEISGKPILNVSVSEKTSKVFYQKDPTKDKELVTAVRANGIEEVVNMSGLQTFYEDVLREVDLYQNDITILKNRFVSPLSRIAPDFYKFYLTDTVEVDNERCIVLSFYPHNKSAFGFIGHVYVPLGDTTMFIKKVDMRIPDGINLNFIDNLSISQKFRKAPDGTRLKVQDDIIMEVTVIPGTPTLYARRNVAYANHSFTQPADSSIFSELGSQIMASDAKDKPADYWEKARLIDIQQGESRVDQLMSSLRSVPLYYWGEKVLRVLVKGYVPTGKNSKFDYGPVNTTISHGSIDGLRLRVGGMTTANLSKRWFGRGYVAYGMRDKKFKYKGELEYSFIDKEYHSREFPVRSLKLTHQYDRDNLGQQYLFTNQDNFFLSLKRMSDIQSTTYNRKTQLEYKLELENNLSFTVTLKHARQEKTPWVSFTTGDGRTFDHFDEASVMFKVRYAPGEKFYQATSYRIPINLDAPEIILSHTFAKKGFLNSLFPINKTEINIQKRFWFSAFGYMDVMLGGGHVWSKSAYPDLLIPNANLTYIIEPQSFALMNPMEFVNTTYGSWDITYWANGAIFNYIPLLKKLKLREAFEFRGVYGTMNKNCDPRYNKELLAFPDGVPARKMTSGPYMEAGVGIDNILRCIRLDYVWRLSYLNTSYAIDKRGLRIAMHFTF